MPRSTVKYLFEHGILGWAQDFRQGDGFLAVFSPTGEVIEVHMGEVTQSGSRLVSHERKERLMQVHSRWMYYDPFDWPEYAWLEWREVPRAALEQMLSEPMLQALRAGKAGLEELPESWSVMF